MPDSIREQIIQAFMSRAATITGGAFNVGMGANVFRGIKEVDPGSLPACVIFPQPETVERREFGQYLCVMPVRVDGIAEVGGENPSVLAERMLADFRKAFMEPGLSPLIEDIQYAGGGTDEYPDSGHKTVAAYSLFTVQYQTRITDPYST